MTLFSLALRNLKRRPIRTFLSVLGIGLAVGSALALVALSRNIQDSAREATDEIGDDLVVMQKGASDIFGGLIPEQIVERIAAIHGVANVSGELVAFAPNSSVKSVLTLGWPDASYLWKKVPLREGRIPTAGERHVAVLGDTAAASLGKELNDELDLFGQTFRIVGVARYTTVVNRGLALVPLIDLQEANYRPHQVTIAHVKIERAHSHDELERIRGEIDGLGNVVAATTNEVLDNDRNFAIAEAASLAVAIIAVAMSALNVLTALAMATQERTREIGIFAAVGWTNGQIIKSIVIEGIMLCAIGCAVGVLLSFFAASAFHRIPTIGNLISLQPGIGLIAPVVGAAFLLCILGALFPAWRAVRMLPAEALRRM
ncbi:MAG TPA: ABC transporter permease [Xanthobacteraceae bacterium]|nr:ABC transporter permease [Xanthobacteraceae bacterium]